MLKKTFTNAGHIDAKLIDFSEICPKKPSEIGCFLLIVSWRNFPWNRPIFLRICPWKSFENWLFSAKIPQNGPIFLRILTFLPRKSPEIGRLFREFWLFSHENPAKSADFSANLPLKILRNFAFFSREISEALYNSPHVFYCKVQSDNPRWKTLFVCPKTGCVWAKNRFDRTTWPAPGLNIVMATVYMLKWNSNMIATTLCENN